MNATRRQILKTAMAAPAVLSAQTRPPNLVFIISDDHSYSDLGCYGNRAVRTPNLDRLASEGMRFTHAYVTSPQCSPNRSSILTGEYAHSTSTSRLHTPMPAWQPTVLEWLKGHGYFAGAFRKVHQGEAFNKRFDFYAGEKARFEDFFDAVPANRPFFLHVGFTDPHRPYAAGAFDPPHDPASVKIPEWLPDTPEIRRDVAMYYDEIARMDRESGQVLDLLNKRGLAGNTLVIFTADNGMPFPPRAKGTLYEHGIRVPFIARWPGRIKPGSESSSLVSHIDLAPTWIDAAGARRSSRLQGVSQLPVMQGGSTPVRREIYSERNWHDNFDLIRCVRTERYKLIYNGMPHRPHRPISDLADSPTWASFMELANTGKLEARHREALAPTRPMLELYDLENDPNERTNMADDPKLGDVQKDLMGKLEAWMNGTADFLPPPYRIFQGKQRPTL